MLELEDESVLYLIVGAHPQTSLAVLLTLQHEGRLLVERKRNAVVFDLKAGELVRLSAGPGLRRTCYGEGADICMEALAAGKLQKKQANNDGKVQHRNQEVRSAYTFFHFRAL